MLQKTLAMTKHEFLFGQTAAIDKVDDVIWTQLLATCRSKVLAGLRRDGEFECGLWHKPVRIPDTAALAGVKSGRNFGQNAFEVDFHRAFIFPSSPFPLYSFPFLSVDDILISFSFLAIVLLVSFPCYKGGKERKGKVIKSGEIESRGLSYSGREP
jgi:hypothetical protein